LRKVAQFFRQKFLDCRKDREKFSRCFPRAGAWNGSLSRITGIYQLRKTDQKH